MTQEPFVVEAVFRTHISTVVLAGDFAYKIKKPVTLPFLDFSSVKARSFYCEEELRLNRRTAPDLYLDVVPVTGWPDAPVFGEAVQGEPQDWALRMRRFSQEGLWSALADSGALTEAHADALAEHLAGFHLTLLPMPEGWRPRKPVEDWARESLDEIAASAVRPRALSTERLENLRKALLGLLKELLPWRESRLAEGHVREGHGDLHLGNIVQWQGRPTAFDAIEFEPDLRCIDVMHDVSFVYMDLLAHGLPVLAARFMNAHVERTGDFDGLRGLRLYAACSALVRAKVALLSGAGEPVFERYWNVAERLVLQPACTALVLTMGLSGAGKSTVAQAVVAALAGRGAQAFRVRSDVERKRLYGVAPTDRPGARLYTPEVTERTYARLRELASGLLAAGYVAVVDAAFLRQHERDAMCELAEARGVRFAVLECMAAPQTMRERLSMRQAEGRDASDATVAVLEQQMAFSEPVPDDWAPWHVRVPNDGSWAELQAWVNAWVVDWLPAAGQSVNG
jgi:aminoglycoside phosphotransferase family enzyme/predicted kinase